MPRKRGFDDGGPALDWRTDHVPGAAGLGEASRTGLTKIQVPSFTSAKSIATLQHGNAVMHQIERTPCVSYAHYKLYKPCPNLISRVWPCC
ncbi:hypothetical protein O4H66_27190 [Comamonadaceae bacterium G21597-S1]|nr:hypothetical protein [Comamonadaceae bacterium G21597-S1]